MMAVARRLERTGHLLKGGGARNFGGDTSSSPRGYRLSRVRIMELKEYFGGGLGEESSFGSDLAARCGVTLSFMRPSSEDTDLVGAERYAFGTAAHEAFVKLERARRAVEKLGTSSARVLCAAYGPSRVRPDVQAKYNLEHRLEALPNLVLITSVLMKHRVVMIAKKVAETIRRADEAAERARDGVERMTFKEMDASTRCGSTNSVSRPWLPAQRDVSHASIRRGTEAEITPQVALEDALCLMPHPPKDHEAIRRSFVLESTREADELLASASKHYHSVWKGT